MVVLLHSNILHVTQKKSKLLPDYRYVCREQNGLSMFLKMGVWVAPSFHVVLEAKHPQPWGVEKSLCKENIITLYICEEACVQSRLLPLRYRRVWLFMPPRVSPPKWHCKGNREHGNELCTSSERGVKRGNFWNDGCQRWCPMCFSSLEFTASAALCKQLGSKTGCSAISSSLFRSPPPPPSFFMLGWQCPWENIILDFSGGMLIVPCLLFGCQYCSFYRCIYHWWQNRIVVLNVYRRAFSPV